MHECPECGQACDCDGEDTWLDSEADNCTHDCGPEFDDGLYDEFDEYYEPAPGTEGGAAIAARLERERDAAEKALAECRKLLSKIHEQQPASMEEADQLLPIAYAARLALCDFAANDIRRVIDAALAARGAKGE